MSNTASLDDVVVHGDFDVQDRCDICGMRAWFRAIYVLVSFFFLNVFSAPLASASDYSASITTSGDVTLNVLNGNTSIEESSINVTTNCKAGYDLTLKSTVEDNNLYLDGDSSNNSAGTYIAPGDGTSTLGNSSSRWGYFISSDSTIPTTSSVFLPVPTALQTAASLKTIAETVSETDIDDSFKIYYGVNAGMGLGAGSYTMVPESSEIDAPRGGLAYYLIVNPSCTTSLEISFNKNLDGEGGETGDEIISNFPTSNDNTIDTVNNAVILSTKRPTREGYTFKEWNTEPDGSGDYFRVGETIPLGVGSLSGFVTLYAIWVEDCPSATICYDGNHADAGAMNPQSFNAGATTNLIASNFSRSGYGFTGWNTEADGTGTQYGPNQNFTMPSTGGVNLYAQWLAPSGTLQSFSSSNIASNMNTGDVLALEDDRDGEVYMVAKLADGNIWITENLRLLPNTVTITNRNTNHPTNDFISDAPSSSSSTSQCFGDNATCVNQINYNAHNLDRSLTPAYDGSTNNTYWYSYGVMYNWYTATAGNGTYELTSTSAAGDLCPAGWHLPTGGASGEWGVLASNMPGNNGTAKSASLRSYPNNFLYSGDYNPSKDIPDGVGRQGRIWSTTPVSSNIKNAYRMGYNSTEVTAATSNSWNKWDNFAIRCIYQGGNVLYSDVEVDFEGTGITSLTFTSQGQDTEIATPQNPTISLAENVTYDVIATLTTGYEVASWATSSGGTLGNSTTTNPAPSTNTYTITSNATLTVTGQLTPIYTVTTTLGEHVSSISFMSNDYGTETITPASSSCTVNQDNTYTCTIDLRRGVEYTISGTYESGYGFDAWATGAGGTLGDASNNVTTYTITSATTLSLTAKEAEDMTYTLIYHAGSGTDAPASETITSQNPSESFTITNLTPIYYGYTFAGWSETADANNNGTTIDYVSGDTITITGTSTTNTKTLYPVYQAVATCPANNICYYDNGADVNGGGRGTMANQSSNTTKLIPSNYSRTGYGFAGWTTAENATPFGPNATIDSSLVSSGLVLYAKWVKSEGDLQSWRGCNAMTENQVIALTDTRDNNVYAVAKLADGNCWTIENLRLDPGLATITAQNTHNPTSTFITESTTNDGSGNPVSLSTDTLCGTDNDATCINSIQYNTSSINRSLTPNKSASSSSWYSYGVYYNWYTATAGNGVMDTASGANVSGDICPKNWHLPTSTNSGEWATLNRVVNGGVSNADAGLRTYPVNLIWSGDYSSGRTSGYGNGRYWSSTGFDTNNAYRMGHQESGSKGATPSGNYKKWDGFAVRCIRDEVTAEYSDLTVTLPQNVQSITFTHPQYGTETATAQNPTVSLAQDTSYTMTATFVTGYELDSWTAGANATIADSTANPTTIIITDDSTLTLTTSEIPTYTVTVNLDSGSTSVTFMNANYPTQTVTTTGSTVQLYQNTSYVITTTTNTGYDFSSWSATSGTLGSATANPTTYSTATSSTLTASSEPQTFTCTKQYRLQSVDGTYPSTYTSDGTETLDYNTTCTYTKSQQYYQTQEGTATMTEDRTISLDLPRNTYELTINKNDTYISSVTGAGTHRWGQEVNISATPATGGSFTTWSQTSGTTSTFGDAASATTTFTMPTSDATIYADGEPQTFTCTKQYRLQNADGTYPDTYTSDGTETKDYNTTCTYTKSETNYQTQEGTATMTENRTISLDLPRNTYELTINKNDTYISSVTGANAYRWGEEVNISATLEPNSRFVSWSQTSGTTSTFGDATSATTTFIMPTSNATIYANGEAIPQYTVTANLDSGISSITFTDSNEDTQTINTNGGTASLYEGASYTITATTATGHTFTNWSTTSTGTLASTTTNPTTYTITGDTTLTASSELITHTITATLPEHITSITFTNPSYPTQTVTTTGSTVNLRYGVPYTIVATTDNGYTLANWTTTESGTLADNTANPTTYAVTGNATLTANAELITHPVTVDFANSEITSITFTSSSTEPQTITTTGSTINLIDNMQYTITATTNPGYVLSAWTTTVSGTLGSTIDNPTTYTVTGNATLTATTKDTYVYINYDGNGLYYNDDPTDTTNEVVYNRTTSTKTVTRYSHTSNIDDNGTATSSSYPSNLNTNDVITIPGATSLHVSLTYQTHSTSYDWASFWAGNYPSYTAGSNYSSGVKCGSNTSGKYGGTTKTTIECDITGDSVTFSFKSNGSSNGYYGYYAVVTADVEIHPLVTVSGTYAIPSSSQAHTFLGWSEGQNAATPTYADENDIMANAPYTYNDSPVTLYAIYSTPQTVTVNMDTNVSSISFHNPTYGTQTVTNENVGTSGATDIVTLYSNTEYLISSSFNMDYTIDTWTTSSTGTLGSATQAATTYTITAPATLSLTSKAPDSISTFTPAMCSNLSVGDIVELKDLRDNSIYKVSKLADNNCWMLDSLRLDLTDSAVKTNLTHSNTNASNSTLNYLKNGGGTTSDRYPTSPVESSMASSYSVPRINATYKDTTSTATYGEGSGKIGVYYNYCAASAGSYCYGNGSSSTGSPVNPTGLIDASEDICPAGWRMPTSSTSGEYQALYATYSSNQADFKAALSTPLSGYFSGGSISSQGTYGDFWSSTYYDASYMYRLYETSSAVTPSSNGYRYQGYPIRCILGAPKYSNVTVTLDSNTTSVTFANPIYGTVIADSNNNTVDLRQGVEYTIAANLASAAYDLSSWTTGANATIGDSNENPTTYTITGDSTLSLSTTEKPSYEVTVNFDENVRSVALYQETLGTQQVTASGGTVSLRKGVEYILTASYNDEHSTNTWITTENGTLGDATSPATTYTVIGTATLTLTSTTKTGATTLNTGQSLNAKMKTLAEGKSTSYDTKSSKIKALKMATFLPSDFTPSTANTVSVANSEKPVYIFFDNTDNAGIMYFYTEARDIYMNANSSYAFYGNTALNDISAVSNWNTGSVTNMRSMFSGYCTYSSSGSYLCLSALTDIDALANWNTSSVTNMSYMFYGASALTNIDGASNWNTGSVTNMSYMFFKASALTNIDGASNWNTGSVTNMSYMFNRARALTNIDGASNWNTGNVTDMSYMFYCAFALTNIDGASNWNTESVTNMSYMFYCAASLVSIDALANWKTSSVTDMSCMFRRASALTNIDGASNWNTSSVTNMSSMFRGVYALTNIDGASSWNTSNVTNMSYMFYYASALTNIDGASSWNTSNVTNMSYMFGEASALTNIDGASNWNTSSVTNMSSMFSSATALTNIDGARNWNINKVTNFSNMYSAPSRPDFNKRHGTWNTSGTFTPISATSSIVVTANLGSHVKNISFYNATYGTRTITNGETVALAKDTEYTITAVYDSGYTIDTWTSASGTIGSTTSLSTTYQTSSDDTLSITSTSTSTSTTTINIDGNVSSISFSHPYYDTIVLTNNNDTITLVNDLDYYVIIEYVNGYKEDSTTTTASGTIGTTTIKGITYTVTGNDTLTITTTAKSGTATLDTGLNLNAKLKTLAEGKSTKYNASSSKIKALKMATFLPSDFTPSTVNTVSVANSEKPVYIFFDNTDNAGIMYFYTEARDIYMNVDSSYAFYYNIALTDISATSNWNTESVTNMSYMFREAYALTNIDGASNWNTGNVTDMSYMFYLAYALTNIDGASNWNTESVTNMSYMFHRAYALTNIDGASNWNTGNVTDMSRMFNTFDGASALTNIDGAANWDTSRVTNMTYMFSYASALTNIDGASNWNTSSVTNMSYMFYGATALTNIDGASNWNTGSVTDMSYMFYAAYALTNIDGASSWNTSSITDMSDMFSDASALTNIDGASNWNTSSVTNMSYMFREASALTNIDGASNWDTSNVTNMSHMFVEASALINIDGASNWNTGNVTDMERMFQNASALTNASGANNWDVRSVTATAGSSSSDSNNFYRMFYSASGSESNPTHPTFTTRSGTWNSDGTFIPNDTTPATSTSTSTSSATNAPSATPSANTSGLSSAPVSASISDSSSNDSVADSGTEGSTKDGFSEPLGASTDDYDDMGNTKTYSETTEVSALSPVLAAISVVAVSTLAGTGTYVFLKKQKEKEDEDDEK